MGLIRLFDYYHDYDYGHDWFWIIGQFSKFNLLQGSLHTNEILYELCEPNFGLHLYFLGGSLFGLKLDINGIRFEIEFLTYYYPMDLEHTREP